MNVIDLRLQLSLPGLPSSEALAPTVVAAGGGDKWARLRTQLEYMAGAQGLAACEVAAANELDPEDLHCIELVARDGTRADCPRLLFRASDAEFCLRVSPSGLRRSKAVWP